MDFSEQLSLISHNLLPKNLEDIIDATKNRIIQMGDKPYVTVSKQLELLSQLTQFDLGRFLLQNKGLNGYWTHYILMYPEIENYKELKPLEIFFLERLPATVATRQRFKIFLHEIQKFVQNNAELASIPCGLMSELLCLDYQGVKDIKLYGIDYDNEALQHAQSFARKQSLINYSQFICKDAWALNFQNKFNVISSNGLNIYEPSDEKVIQLYFNFHQALKPGGKLITSFLTFPPSYPDKCEWNLDHVNKEDLLLQKIIFVDIINGNWQSYRTMEQTRNQLQSVGFINIQFISDQVNQFPTVIAEKSN